MLFACGDSTNECTKLCVSFLDSNGWSILKLPEPLDIDPEMFTPLLAVPLK